MIAVLLAPTASIARHDDHRTDANPVRCFNVLRPHPGIERMRRAHGRRVRALRFSNCYCILREVTYRGQRVCNLRGTGNPRNVRLALAMEISDRFTLARTAMVDDLRCQTFRATIATSTG
jgi:hypothetical protein